MICYKITYGIKPKFYKKMSNLFENRVSGTLTAAQITAAKAALTAVATNVPMLLGLTVEERISIPKVNAGNINFVMDALSLMQNNASMLPAYMSVSELDKDLALYRQLEELLSLTDQLQEKLRDTHMLAGSEAYINSLAFYRMAEAAAKAGLPGADAVYDQLKVRFAGQGGTGTSPDAGAGTGSGTTPVVNPAPL